MNFFGYARRVISWFESAPGGVPCCILGFFFVAQAFIAFDTAILLSGDVSEYFNNAFRFVHGDMPYRDFWLLFPPNEVLIPALFLRIFGETVSAISVGTRILSVISGIGIFLVARLIFRNQWYAFLFALLLFFNGILVHYGNYLMMHLFAGCTIIAAYTIHAYLQGKRPRAHLFLFSVTTSVALFSRFYETLPLLAAGCTTIVIWECTAHRTALKNADILFTVKQIRNSISIVVLGGTLVFLLYGAVIFPIWKEAFFSVILDAPRHGTAVTWPYFQGFFDTTQHLIVLTQTLFHAPSFLGFASLILQKLRFVKEIIHYIFPFFIVCIGVWTLMHPVGKRLSREEKIFTTFLLIWGVFSFPKAWFRPSLLNLAFSCTPFFALLLFLIQYLYPSRLRKILIGTVMILFIPFFVFPVQSIKAQTRKQSAIMSSSGAFAVRESARAEAITKVVAYIQNRTQREEPVFATPWDVPWYVLLHRKNPTYYDSLIDLFYRPDRAKERRVCNELETAQTSFIVHSTEGTRARTEFAAALPTLESCLRSRYELSQNFGEYAVLERKK